MPVTVRNDNVLIINTKGGGHAFIGLYLARELMKKGHKVSILNDGDAVRYQIVSHTLHPHTCWPAE